jgi:mono/diheme cytochrome c family protein
VQSAECRVPGAVQGAECTVPGAVQGARSRVLGARCRVRRAMVVVLALLCAAGFSAAQQAPVATPVGSELPAGEGAAVVKARCLSCHGTDLITSQRLSDAGWSRELDKMVRWGASLSDAERASAVPYLALHFGPKPVGAHSTAHDGEAVFARACLTCHGADLTEQQQLSPAGWTREVEKMMRWGARLAEADKDALVRYLAARYPAR